MTEGSTYDAYGGSGQSGTAQAQEKAQEVAGQAQQKAQEAKAKAGGRVREEVDRRSTEAGEQAKSMAEAFRRTGEQLRNEGNDQPARLAEQAGERVERLGGYLTRVDADRILHDVEEFGRRRPWVLALGGAVVGFAASRFLKASSSGRYQAVQEGDGSWTAGPRPGMEPAPPPPAVPPAPTTRPGLDVPAAPGAGTPQTPTETY